MSDTSARGTLSRVFGTKRRQKVPPSPNAPLLTLPYDLTQQPVQSKQETDLPTLFTLDDSAKRLSKDEEKKVDELAALCRSLGASHFSRANFEYAIRVHDGDVRRAAQLMFLYRDSLQGVLVQCNPDVAMKGAENREKVTCYLDSLLFALFAKSDIFEGMVVSDFESGCRRRLVIVLRVWINMLRSGHLITTDVTRELQEAMAACGWADAATIKQQDVSEAFGFLTDQLELPLLTLKTDLYHAGKEDDTDDHKFIMERLLDVAIPEDTDGAPVKLETCLEDYFNNRVEVRRELLRRNTRPASDEDSGDEKPPGAVHVEVAEVDPALDSPVETVKLPGPAFLRDRKLSIFSERRVIVQGVDPNAGPSDAHFLEKTKKEVTMPAWQFLNLIPWYTKTHASEQGDRSQVAPYFARTRPMLGICLKRYKYGMDGTSEPLDTHVEIPLEMSSPRFAISDNAKTDDLASQRFRLSLQSVVCHRGPNVTSGHYISVVRMPIRPVSRDSGCDLERLPTPEQQEDDIWLKNDDMAAERVTQVKIQDILQQERPYLLFYRVMPLGDMANVDELPPYDEPGGALTNIDEKLNSLSSEDGRQSLDVDGSSYSRRASIVPSNQTESRASMSSDRRGAQLSGSGVATGVTTPGEEMRTAILDDTDDSRGSPRSAPAAARRSNESVTFISRITSRLNREKPDISVSAVVDDDAAGIDQPPRDMERERLPVGDTRDARRASKSPGSKSKERSKDRVSRLMSRRGSVVRRRRKSSTEAEQTCTLM